MIMGGNKIEVQEKEKFERQPSVYNREPCLLFAIIIIGVVVLGIGMGWAIIGFADMGYSNLRDDADNPNTAGSTLNPEDITHSPTMDTQVDHMTDFEMLKNRLIVVEIKAARTEVDAAAAKIKANRAISGAVEAQNEAAAAKIEATAATSEADEAKTEANAAQIEAAAAKIEATAAKSQANAAQIDAAAAKSEANAAQIEAAAAKSEANAAQIEAAAAKMEADEAKSEADAARNESIAAKSEADEAKNAANAAQIEATAAKAEAGAAQFEASTAKIEADAAKSEADAAKNESIAAQIEAAAAKSEAAAAKIEALNASNKAYDAITKADILQVELYEWIANSSAKEDKYSASTSTYVHWGRTTCDVNGTYLVYTGFAGGAWYTDGSAANYVCLTDEPTWEHDSLGNGPDYGRIYGGEFQLNYDWPFKTDNVDGGLHQQDVPCAVCETEGRGSNLMIPGTQVCPPGWTHEYKGHLMSGKYDSKRTEYICVDESPEVIPNGGGNTNGALFYYVRAGCGALPCPPYENNREVTCVVCTK